MDPLSSFRYAEAEQMKPASRTEREFQRLVPLMLSKSLSELSPEADIMDVI